MSTPSSHGCHEKQLPAFSASAIASIVPVPLRYPMTDAHLGQPGFGTDRAGSMFPKNSTSVALTRTSCPGTPASSTLFLGTVLVLDKLVY